MEFLTCWMGKDTDGRLGWIAAWASGNTAEK